MVLNNRQHAESLLMLSKAWIYRQGDKSLYCL